MLCKCIRPTLKDNKPNHITPICAYVYCRHHSAVVYSLSSHAKARKFDSPLKMKNENLPCCGDVVSSVAISVDDRCDAVDSGRLKSCCSKWCHWWHQCWQCCRLLWSLCSKRWQCCRNLKANLVMFSTPQLPVSTIMQHRSGLWCKVEVSKNCDTKDKMNKKPKKIFHLQYKHHAQRKVKKLIERRSKTAFHGMLKAGQVCTCVLG